MIFTDSSRHIPKITASPVCTAIKTTPIATNYAFHFHRALKFRLCIFLNAPWSPAGASPLDPTGDLRPPDPLICPPTPPSRSAPGLVVREKMRSSEWFLLFGDRESHKNFASIPLYPNGVCVRVTYAYCHWGWHQFWFLFNHSISLEITLRSEVSRGDSWSCTFYRLDAVAPTQQQCQSSALNGAYDTCTVARDCGACLSLSYAVSCAVCYNYRTQ